MLRPGHSGQFANVGHREVILATHDDELYLIVVREMPINQIELSLCPLTAFIFVLELKR